MLRSQIPEVFEKSRCEQKRRVCSSSHSSMSLPALHFELVATPACLEFRDNNVLAFSFSGDRFLFSSTEQFHEYLNSLHGPEAAQEVTELMAKHTSVFA
jgi:hypothetical protein